MRPLIIRRAPLVPSVVGNLTYDRFRKQLDSIDYTLSSIRASKSASSRPHSIRNSPSTRPKQNLQIVFLFLESRGPSTAVLSARYPDGRELARLRPNARRKPVAPVVPPHRPSSLQRYCEMLDASGLRQVVMALVQSASSGE